MCNVVVAGLEVAKQDSLEAAQAAVPSNVGYKGPAAKLDMVDSKCPAAARTEAAHVDREETELKMVIQTAVRDL